MYKKKCGHPYLVGFAKVMTSSLSSESLESVPTDLDSSSSSRMTELLFEIESTRSTPPNVGHVDTEPSKKTKLLPTDIFNDSFNSSGVSMMLFDDSNSLFECSNNLLECSKTLLRGVGSSGALSRIWKSFSKFFWFSDLSEQFECFLEVLSFSGCFVGDDDVAGFPDFWWLSIRSQALPKITMDAKILKIIIISRVAYIAVLIVCT